VLLFVISLPLPPFCCFSCFYSSVLLVGVILAYNNKNIQSFVFVFAPFPCELHLAKNSFFGSASTTQTQSVLWCQISCIVCSSSPADCLMWRVWVKLNAIGIVRIRVGVTPRVGAWLSRDKEGSTSYGGLEKIRRGGEGGWWSGTTIFG